MINLIRTENLLFKLKIEALATIFHNGRRKRKYITNFAKFRNSFTWLNGSKILQYYYKQQQRKHVSYLNSCVIAVS